VIKAQTRQDNGRSLVLLGLVEGNVERLEAGQPIKFSGEQVGIEGVDLAILYGDTEEVIIEELEKAGVELPEGTLAAVHEARAAHGIRQTGRLQ
jgi:hypothetical protein